MYPPTVFISYRRQDCGQEATLLYSQLTKQLHPVGGYVFFDEHSMRPSSQLEWSMTFCVRYCRLFVAMIGPDWLPILQTRAQLNEPDWVVHEVATALRARVLILPVYVRGAKPPTASELPTTIRDLVNYKYLEFRPEDSGNDTLVEDIIAILERPALTEPPRTPSSREDRRWIRRIGVSLKRARKDKRNIADALDYACQYLRRRDIDALVEHLRDCPGEASRTIATFLGDDRVFNAYTGNVSSIADKLWEDRETFLDTVRWLRREVRHVRSQPELIDEFVNAWESLRNMVCKLPASMADSAAFSTVCDDIAFCMLGTRLIADKSFFPSDGAKPVHAASLHITAELMIQAVQQLNEVIRGDVMDWRKDD